MDISFSSFTLYISSKSGIVTLRLIAMRIEYHHTSCGFFFIIASHSVIILLTSIPSPALMLIKFINYSLHLIPATFHSLMCMCSNVFIFFLFCFYLVLYRLFKFSSLFNFVSSLSHGKFSIILCDFLIYLFFFICEVFLFIHLFFLFLLNLLSASFISFFSSSSDNNILLT